MTTFRSFPAPHEIRAQTPVECWRHGCEQPAEAGGHGLCAAHYEQALDDVRKDSYDLPQRLADDER